jgi:2-succinyl-5-enolpyruvyl-6-hydroxy-3-cyclohexene-1-carboxylate synthase
LIVGDLSLLHDLNSLALVKNCGRRIIVIAINNDGGGIFHRLPIAHREAQFERMFAMPQSIASFEMSATQFGLLYARPESMNQFRSTYSRLVSSHESCLLEVVCNRRHDCQFTADLLERTGRDCR